MTKPSEQNKKPRAKVRIKDLAAKMPKNYKPREVDWGPPVGKEIIPVPYTHSKPL